MNKKTFTHFFFFTLMSFGFLTTSVLAQTGNIRGKVQDQKNEHIPFATVQLEGTQMGASTDDNGNYTIQNVAYGPYTLIVSYVGYKTFSQSVTVNSSDVELDIVLVSDYIGLNEVVVVGYGTKQVKDLTGSVSSVSSKDFLNGNVATPEQLITGKVAGVEITSNGGAPGSGSRIRIRGGTSLNASNDPLIVIDGVPVANSGINGSANALNLINPNDIENITILKDASASAIYGSRAANGVIIITTKKGSANAKFGISFLTTNSVAKITNYVPVLSAAVFRATVDSAQQHLLGSASTDWQKEIYRTAFSTDNDLTFSGGIKILPYRLSLEYLNQEGILLRSQMNRTSVSLNLSPSFLKNSLKVEVSTKFAYTKNFFTDQGAIGSAVTFDPTQPVRVDSSAYGGYFEWLTAGKPNVLAPRNPLGLINGKDDKSNVYRFLGNIQLDYTLPFLPALRANLNLGTDLSRSNGTVFVPASAASAFTQQGVNNQYSQVKNNKLLEFYLNYLKEIKQISSKVDFTAGYSYQDWLDTTPSFPNINAVGDTLTPAGIPFKTQNTLISFYGRLNYTLMGRYLLTVTLRDDGSSRFSPDNRWGLFPSAAVAWRISDESFLKNSKFISNLKLRLGYGVTGQQDIFADYPYINNYTQGTSTAQYQFGYDESGNPLFFYVLRPDGYDANIKWEQTATYNVGLDFGFHNGRVNGSIDWYDKKTTDLLAVIPLPEGTNFKNNILTNVGSMENKGVEVMLDVIPFDNQTFTWEIGANATFNHNEITKLTAVPDSSTLGILVGGISGGIGNTIQIQSVGYPVFTFYAYQQRYDENGKPVAAVSNAIADTAAFVDRNHDGKITPSDLYRLNKSPEPKVSISFYSTFVYKNWSAGFQLRGNFGNYMYNNVNSQLGNHTQIDASKGYLSNLTENYLETLFPKPEYLSDYYIEDASFVRCDNINIGYNFKSIMKKNISLKVSAIVQNVFVITGYSGLDPEIAGGIDNNIYPRPRIYSLSLNLHL